MGLIMIRGKKRLAIALIGSLGAVLAVGGCGGSSGKPVDPVLLGVLDDSCAEIPAGTTGGFRLLPAGAVRLRVIAAWPSADLVVNANGTELEKVGPSDTQRQSDLKAAGTAYWVPVDIDPNPNPPIWTVHVELPQSMRAGPLTLDISSRTPGGESSSALSVSVVRDMSAQAPTFDRVELDWRDRVNEAGYLLERAENGGPYTPLVSIGKDARGYTDNSVRGETTYSYRLTAQACAPPLNNGQGIGFSRSTAEVTTPREPKSGVERITLSRPPSSPSADPFVYSTPLSLFAPLQNAVVTSVTNVAEDVNGVQRVRLGYVKHTDLNSVSRSDTAPGTACDQPATALAPGESSSAFDGQTVAGRWEVRVVCISNALLRDHIELSISWREP